MSLVARSGTGARSGGFAGLGGRENRHSAGCRQDGAIPSIAFCGLRAAGGPRDCLCCYHKAWRIKREHRFQLSVKLWSIIGARRVIHNQIAQEGSNHSD